LRQTPAIAGGAFLQIKILPRIKNPAKDFCWWDLDGVVVVCRAVVDGSLDLSARATSFFI
jgi:hypothetical protein